MKNKFLFVLSLWMLSLPSSAVQYTYDALHRLTAAIYSSSQRIDYIYDAAGNLIEERTNGSAGISVSAQPNTGAGGTVTLTPAQSAYVAGDIVTATATPAPGYTFTGWSGLPACASTSACTFTVAANNVALVANFTPPSNLFPLRTQAFPAAGGSITPAPSASGYAAGTSITLTATPAPGYVIDYWYGSGCTNYSGTTCTFTMPARDADVYVVFKQAGSGYLFSTAMGMVSGAPGNPLAAGAVVVSPSQQRIAAGTQVTLNFVAAAGYRFDSQGLYVNGVLDTSLCQMLFIGETQCTFTMPAGDVHVDAYYAPDPVRYPLDLSKSPVDGGIVKVAISPNTLPNYYIVDDYDYSVTPPRRRVAAGATVTLTAQPLSSRTFVRWVNGPCINSTNPVCVFTMPAAATVSNAEFGAEPDDACTYSISAPSLAFPGTGGTRSLTVNTQAGCQFNATVQHINGDGPFTLAVSGNTVNLTAPAHASAYGKLGQLRIHTGRKVFVYAVAQAGSNSTTQVSLPTIDLGHVGAGDIPTTSTNVTLTNTSGVAQTLQPPMTTGPFAVSGNTCPYTLGAGASCTLSVQFVPRQSGAAQGELLLAAKSMIWQAGLTGNGLATRENVAAAAAGGSVIASDRLGYEYGEAALINGDRRAVFVDDQGYWVSNSTTPRTLELRFASARTVEWVYLFGRAASPTQPEPFGTSVSASNATGIADFTLDYWSGASWVPVTELTRVSAPNQWQRANFNPVTTDRMRITIAPSPSNQMSASEIEVWTVASDASPDAFAFTSVADVPVSSVITSGSVTPSGFNVPTSIQVTGGAYSIGCTGTFTTASGTINPGQSVCVQHTSSASAGANATTTLTIGGVSASFTSTTANEVVIPVDSTPDPMASQSVTQVLPGSVVVSAAFMVTGINTSVPISIVNGDYSVGCTGSYTNASGTVANNQGVCLRHSASPTYSTTVVSTLTVGGVSVSLSSTTIGTPVQLSVTMNGVGSGVVSSNPTGIQCGADCTEDYGLGTVVTLTAIASGGSSFAGWTGCDSVSGLNCTVSMINNRAVSASFALSSYQLGVNSSGVAGAVIASSTGHGGTTNYIRAGLASGTAVTLNATATSGTATFTGWSGCDSTIGTSCSVTLTSNKTVTANFVHAQGPSVTTLAATSVTQTGAVLNGSVNPNGTATAAEFEYGLTTIYGQSVIFGALSGTTSQSVSKQLTGLACGSTYHYRLRASTTEGWVYGADQSFTTTACSLYSLAVRSGGVSKVSITSSSGHEGITNYTRTGLISGSSAILNAPEVFTGAVFTGWSGCTSVLATECTVFMSGNKTVTANYVIPPDPTAVTQAASQITQTTAMLNALVNPNGGLPDVEFEYGPTTLFGTNVLFGRLSGQTDQAISKQITGLSCGTTYHFRVKATKFGGWVYGEDQVFSTAACTTYALAVRSSGISQVDIASSTGHAGITNYTKSGLTPGSNAILTAPLRFDGASFSNWTGCTATTGAECRMSMTGNKTITANYTAPPPPTVTTQAASSLTQSSAILNAMVNANGGFPVVEFDYGLTTAFGSNAAYGSISGTSDKAVAKKISGLACGKQYYFRAKASKVGGWVYGARLTFTTPACAQYSLAVRSSGISKVAIASTTGHEGTTSYTKSGVLSGSSINLTAPLTFGGAIFSGWTGCTTTVGTECAITMTGNKTITANYLIPPDPIVVTDPASLIKQTSAGFNATVNPNGGTPEVVFDYGLTTTYGSSAMYGALPGQSSQPVTLTVDGLICATTYHYRVKASKVGGWVYGADQSFTTSPCTVYSLAVRSNGVSKVAITSTTGHDGTTNYTKSGLIAGSTAILTAPLTFGGANFSAWAGCTSTTTNVCEMTMSGNKTVTAYYVVPTPLSLASPSLNGSESIAVGDMDLIQVALAPEVGQGAVDLVWTSGGDAPWTTQLRNDIHGGTAAQSGKILDNQISWLETHVAGPGVLGFSWRVSSEASPDNLGCKDSLALYIDGSLSSQVNSGFGYICGDPGPGVWLNEKLEIPAGDHVLTWQYSKNASQAVGEDTSWLDDVVWLPNL